MPRRFWARIGLVVVVIALSIFYLYPPWRAINLGLDLQGGIHLVLGVDADKAIGNQVEHAAHRDLQPGDAQQASEDEQVGQERRHWNCRFQNSDCRLQIAGEGAGRRLSCASVRRESCAAATPPASRRERPPGRRAT